MSDPKLEPGRRRTRTLALAKVELEVRREVYMFAKKMEAKLVQNDDKQHWLAPGTPSVAYHMARLKEEMGELFQAINKGESAEDVEGECADVANFAMFIAGRYRQEERDAR